MKECPNCGADVPRGAKACPECGSDENTGWSETAYAADLDLPLSDEEFSYEEFTKREFGHKKTLSTGISWYWWAVAVVVLGAVIFMFVR